jgi:enoyl-CoA hydratase/carnithine racemase
MSAMNKPIDRPQDMVPLAREGAVAVLTLNFPARRNAYCLQMRTQLRERLETVHADAEVRAIVLTGAAGHFCAGGDITEMPSPSSRRSKAARWARACRLPPSPTTWSLHGMQSLPPPS